MTGRVKKSYRKTENDWKWFTDEMTTYLTATVMGVRCENWGNAQSNVSKKDIKNSVPE